MTGWRRFAKRFSLGSFLVPLLLLLLAGRLFGAW